MGSVKIETNVLRMTTLTSPLPACGDDGRFSLVARRGDAPPVDTPNGRNNSLPTRQTAGPAILRL